MDTSNTTSNTSVSNGTDTVFVKVKSLKNPKVVDAITKAKKNKLNVNVIENKLQYISEVKDKTTGDYSKPFTIKGKKYQMVRALTHDNVDTLAVACIDESDSDGNEILYTVDDFEKNIVGSKPEDLNNDTDTPPSFAGFKHFIVNSKTGKARKFKTIEDLAKANMSDGEKYMGIKDFKKFVDETLFGGKKNKLIEDDTINTSKPTDNVIGGNNQNDGVNTDLQNKSKKLIKLISQKIPSQVIDSIETNKKAQIEILLLFSELIGVPKNGLSTFISGIKDISKTNNVNETKKVIKIKDLI